MGLVKQYNNLINSTIDEQMGSSFEKKRKSIDSQIYYQKSLFQKGKYKQTSKKKRQDRNNINSEYNEQTMGKNMVKIQYAGSWDSYKNGFMKNYIYPHDNQEVLSYAQKKISITTSSAKGTRQLIPLELSFWNIYMQMNKASIANIYFRDIDQTIFIVFFNHASNESFNFATTFLDKLWEQLTQQISPTEVKCVVVLVGVYCRQKNRQVKQADIDGLVDKYKCFYFECQAVVSDQLKDEQEYYRQCKFNNKNHEIMKKCVKIHLMVNKGNRGFEEELIENQLATIKKQQDCIRDCVQEVLEYHSIVVQAENHYIQLVNKFTNSTQNNNIQKQVTGYIILLQELFLSDAQSQSNARELQTLLYISNNLKQPIHHNLKEQSQIINGKHDAQDSINAQHLQILINLHKNRLEKSRRSLLENKQKLGDINKYKAWYSSICTLQKELNQKYGECMKVYSAIHKYSGEVKMTDRQPQSNYVPKQDKIRQNQMLQLKSQATISKNLFQSNFKRCHHILQFAHRFTSILYFAHQMHILHQPPSDIDQLSTSQFILSMAKKYIQKKLDENKHVKEVKQATQKIKESPNEKQKIDEILIKTRQLKKECKQLSQQLYQCKKQAITIQGLCDRNHSCRKQQKQRQLKIKKSNYKVLTQLIGKQ